jgi:hypothetical protein
MALLNIYSTVPEQVEKYSFGRNSDTDVPSEATNGKCRFAFDEPHYVFTSRILLAAPEALTRTLAKLRSVNQGLSD